jgi:dTDP-4-amino-4,6-dideoxygalactose transaminase
VAVPVDLDVGALSVHADDVRAAVTPRTRAILVAHLFGSRMPLDAIAAVARDHDLLLIEDCAQANDGSGYRGHAASDVAMFSFGPIKRQTAMGGAVLGFRDAGLAGRVRQTVASYPRQSRGAYARRIATMAGIKALSYRPVFGAFVTLCRWTGRDHDETLGTALRAFAKGDLFARLRQQPSAPLLATLGRRLRQSPAREIDARVRVVRTVTAEFPQLCRPGTGAAHHTHWLFPMLAHEPERVMRQLWSRGYDATRGASNLVSVPAPSGRPAPTNAERLMREVLYLPLSPSAPDADMRQMARAVRGLVEGAGE